MSLKKEEKITQLAVCDSISYALRFANEQYQNRRNIIVEHNNTFPEDKKPYPEYPTFEEIMSRAEEFIKVYVKYSGGVK